MTDKAPTPPLTGAELDKHLDAVLRASGSALRHYTMQKTLDDMRAAMSEAMSCGAQARAQQAGAAPSGDVKHEFEKWASNRGEAAVYIGDGLYQSSAITDQAEAFAAGVALGRAALAQQPSIVHLSPESARMSDSQAAPCQYCGRKDGAHDKAYPHPRFNASPDAAPVAVSPSDAMSDHEFKQMKRILSAAGVYVSSDFSKDAAMPCFWSLIGQIANMLEAPSDATGKADAANAGGQSIAPEWVYRSARDLAVSIWRDNYKATAPQWEPLDDLPGVISQIDNMVTGMRRVANVGEVHPDDLAVDRFAAAMKGKMAAARAKGRGGWNDPEQCPIERLQSMLTDHVAKGDPVDVGNFAMMLFNRGERTATSTAGVKDAERWRMLPAVAEDHQINLLKLYRDIDAAIAAQQAAPVAKVEPVAWARKWHIDGEKPAKEKNENGRLAWPQKFKFHPVTPHKVFKDDVPLRVDLDAQQAQSSAKGGDAVGGA